VGIELGEREWNYGTFFDGFGFFFFTLSLCRVDGFLFGHSGQFSGVSGRLMLVLWEGVLVMLQLLGKRA